MNKKIGSSSTGWSIQSINGIELPKLPSTLSHEVYTIERDSYEDIHGAIQRPAILGERNKFILTFPMMLKDEYDQFLVLLRANELTITYEDFWDRSILRTEQFYRSDLYKSPYWIKHDDEIIYNTLSVDFTACALQPIEMQIEVD